MQEPLVLDLYSSLSHKAPFDASRLPRMSPAWVRRGEDQRRLAAYYVRACYLANTARHLLEDDVRAGDRREYGDSKLLVRKIVAAILGADFGISVDGADDDLTPPAVPAMPVFESTGDEAVDAALAPIREREVAAWRDAAVASATEWSRRLDESPRRREAQEALRSWAVRSRLAGRIRDLETNAVGLGDGVLVLWPQGVGWPKVTVEDPASLFIDDGAEGFDGRGDPKRLHLAWESVEGEGDSARTLLHRITWELVDVNELRTGYLSGERVWVDGDGQPALVAQLRPDEAQLSDDTVVRRRPWMKDLPASDWSRTTCLFSHGVWDLARVGVSGLSDLSDAAARWLHRDVDMNLDVLPVIHLPHDQQPGETWGNSVVDPVAQVLDDVAISDTDAMQAARYLSDPTIFLAGVAGDIGSTMMPGRIFAGGEHGSMNVLDLSVGMERLYEQGDRLLDRLRTNAGVPAEMLGHASADTMSGIALALRLAPFAQSIGEFRMAREPKYRLLLRIAQKMAQVAGVIEPGPLVDARLEFGNYLPTDRDGTIKAVAAGLQAHAISTQTAISMLVASGLPITDANVELQRIRFESGETAKQISDATASEQLAADYLGVELPPRTPPEPVSIVLPEG